MRRYSALSALASALLLAACLNPAKSLEDPSRAWAVANRDAYLGAFFGAAHPLAGGASITVTLRTDGDYQRETQVVLSLIGDGRLAQAEYVTLVGDDLTSQLTALRGVRPDRSRDEIFSRVKIARGKITSRERPELLRAALRLEALPIIPIPDTIMMFPGALYTISVKTLSGSYVFNIRWFLPSDKPGQSSAWGSVGGGNRPLVKWARELLGTVGIEPDTRLPSPGRAPG